MNPSPLAVAVAAIMFAGIAAYAVFAGADFGGGIWDLFAGGPKRGAAPRALIDESMTSVWEGNHVWLVLMLVVLWTGFPTAFASIMTAMFIPLSLSLLGIFFRGVGFSFRHTARSVRTQQLYGAMFACSSFMTPFFLGVVAGAIATGRITVQARGNDLGAWTTPTALLAGGMGIAICAYIGGAYLVGDARRRGDTVLARYFGHRALGAGILTGVLGAATLVALHHDGRYVFDGLFGRALPLVIISVVAGVGGLVLIALHRNWSLRIAAATAVATAIFGWGVAQYPWLLPTTLRLSDGSAPTGALVNELVVGLMVAVLVVPGFVLLYALQQQERLKETSTSGALSEAVARQVRATEGPAQPAGPVAGERILLTAVLFASAAQILRRLRDRVSGTRRS